MAEIRAGLAKFSFRQLPSASADARRVCGGKLEDGKAEINKGAGRNSLQIKEIRAALAKFSFRQLPAVSVSFRATHGQGGGVDH